MPPPDPGLRVVLVREQTEVTSWPLATGCRPGLEVADQLARMQLAARRMGCSIQLRGAPGALVELLDLVGLCGTVVTDPRLSGQAVGQAEDGEQAGVDKVVVTDDHPA